MDSAVIICRRTPRTPTLWLSSAEESREDRCCGHRQHNDTELEKAEAVASGGGHRWATKMETAFSSSGGRKEAMAENTEETAAMVKEGLGTAYARGKIATVVSSKVATSAKLKRETYLLDKSDITLKDGMCGSWLV